LRAVLRGRYPQRLLRLLPALVPATLRYHFHAAPVAHLFHHTRTRGPFTTPLRTPAHRICACAIRLFAATHTPRLARPRFPHRWFLPTRLAFNACLRRTLRTMPLTPASAVPHYYQFYSSRLRHSACLAALVYTRALPGTLRLRSTFDSMPRWCCALPTSIAFTFLYGPFRTPTTFTFLTTRKKKKKKNALLQRANHCLVAAATAAVDTPYRTLRGLRAWRTAVTPHRLPLRLRLTILPRTLNYCDALPRPYTADGSVLLVLDASSPRTSYAT